MISRWIRHGAIVGALLGGFALAGLIAMSVAGYHVLNAVKAALTPYPAPVQDNPGLQAYHGHRVSWLADIEDLNLRESSGLATSTRHKDVVWSINDSGSDPVLYALDLDGHTRAAFTVDTNLDTDWEALDAFIDQSGEHYLVVGDVGDNLRWRPWVNLLFVKEPSLEASAELLKVERVVRVTYPTGPQDCEAIAVDLHRDRVLLLSKRERPPTLYAVPLASADSVQAQEVRRFKNWPLSTERDYYMAPRTAQYLYMPSGMDVYGDQLLVTTYKPLLLFDLKALDRVPRVLNMPEVGQREALTFLDAKTALVSRERREGVGASDLFKVDLEPRPACADIPAQRPCAE